MYKRCSLVFALIILKKLREMIGRVHILFASKTNFEFSIVGPNHPGLAFATKPLVQMYSYQSYEIHSFDSYIFLSSLKKKSINY